MSLPQFPCLVHHGLTFGRIFSIDSAPLRIIVSATANDNRLTLVMETRWMFVCDYCCVLDSNKTYCCDATILIVIISAGFSCQSPIYRSIWMCLTLDFSIKKASLAFQLLSLNHDFIWFSVSDVTHGELPMFHSLQVFLFMGLFCSDTLLSPVFLFRVIFRGTSMKFLKRSTGFVFFFPWVLTGSWLLLFRLSDFLHCFQ
jgi:hypothetical protein